MTPLPNLPEFATHLATAAGLGGIIGMERQLHQGMAGLRTNALVATGGTAFVSLPGIIGAENLGPANMATFLITGIGFLGAGVIMRDGTNIRGLNTAATLWATASVGAFVGAGMALHAATIATAIVSINLFMRPVVLVVNEVSARLGSGVPSVYTVEIVCIAGAQQELRAHLMEGLAKDGLSLRGLQTRDGATKEDEVTLLATVAAHGAGEKRIEHLVARLAVDPCVAAASWTRSDAAENDPKLHAGS